MTEKKRKIPKPWKSKAVETVEVGTKSKETTQEDIVESNAEVILAMTDSYEPRPTVIQEIIISISGSTPTRDFASSLVKFFESTPQSVVLVRSIGAGATHQLLKASIEANKILLPRGKMLSRFDFWTNDNGKSVNNTRFMLVDILPNSLATALTGHNVTYKTLNEFLKDGETSNE